MLSHSAPTYRARANVAAESSSYAQTGHYLEFDVWKDIVAENQSFTQLSVISLLAGVGALLMAIFCKCKKSGTTIMFVAGGVGLLISVVCVIALLYKKQWAHDNRREWLYG